MNVIKSLIFLLFLALFPGLLISCMPSQSRDASSSPVNNADRRFQELVLAKIPNYQLTSSILGRPLRSSDAYTVEFIDGAVLGQSRDVIIKNFIRRFEPSGLKPVRLYFRAGSPVPSLADHWRMDFVGCVPRNCIEQISNSLISRVTKREHDNYFYLARQTKSTTFVLLEKTIDGVMYQASVTVYFDAQGKVYKYFVSSFREALTASEARKGAQVLTSRRLRVPTFRFIRNVTLAIQAQSWNPSYFQIDGIYPLRGL